jgi:acyl-CoA thioesterase I
LTVVNVRALLFHIYSGQMFFSAAAIFTAAALADGLGALDRWPILRRVAGLVALLSVPLAALSGTPIPLFLAVPLFIAAGAYLALGFGGPRRLRAPLAITASALALVAATNEARYHLAGAKIASPAHLYVIGDSLASGGFGEKTPWPVILAQYAGTPATNLALPSETTKMAARNQLPLLPSRMTSAACVVIEIGGNEMLDRVASDRFERGLRTILSTVRDSGARMVMLELPVVPGQWAYGAIQRKLAAEYGALLAPKRIVATVLLDPSNTSDGVHLRQRGHDALARELAAWLGWGRLTSVAR